MADFPDEDIEVSIEEFLKKVNESSFDPQSEPSDNEQINTIRDFHWVVLPNGEPGILLHYLNPERQPVEDHTEAFSIVAMDRYQRMHHFEINEEAIFGKVLLN